LVGSGIHDTIRILISAKYHRDLVRYAAGLKFYWIGNVHLLSTSSFSSLDFFPGTCVGGMRDKGLNTFPYAFMKKNDEHKKRCSQDQESAIPWIFLLFVGRNCLIHSEKHGEINVEWRNGYIKVLRLVYRR